MANVRLEELLGYIRDGRILDAMTEFYADDVVMEEPRYGKTVGLAANVAREEQFVNSVKEWRNFAVTKMAATDEVAFYENIVDFVGVDGVEYHFEQVSVQTWKDGKIVHERFYY
jgi:ketosteroid isomerase-like protein